MGSPIDLDPHSYVGSLHYHVWVLLLFIFAFCKLDFGDGTQVLSASVTGTVLTEPSPPSKTIKRIHTECLLLAAARIVSRRDSDFKNIHHTQPVFLYLLSFKGRLDM